jgi:GGDEF domain-containing protein
MADPDPTPSCDPSMLDASSGLPNRRALFAALRTRVPGDPGALLLLDLDGFRRASRTLKPEQITTLVGEVAARISPAAPGARLHRYSLDSLALLLPGAGRDEAAAVADACRAALSKDAFIIPGERASEIVPLTATAAVAAWPLDGRTPASLLETVELVLLAAKHQGPDRTDVAGRLDPAALAAIGVYRGLPSPVLVGRVEEQQRLRKAAQDVRHVGPSCALVSGPSGLGKSRLLEELGRWARTERFVVLSAPCQESRATLPYAALGEMIEQLLLVDPALVRAALAPLDPLRRAALRVVVRQLPEEGAAAALPSDNCGALIQDSLGALLDELAKAGPLLVLLDEADYGDAATLEVFRAARDRRLPFLAVLASNQDPKSFRTTPAGAFLQDGPPGAPMLQLAPLSKEEGAKLLHAVLPDAVLPEGGAELLVERSAGNPLFLEETVRSLLLKGQAKLADGRWTVASLRPADLPRDLDSAVRAVAEALPARANSLLTRAAVIGSGVDPELLQEVMGQDELETLELLDEARRSRLLVTAEDGSDRLHFPASQARRLRVAAAPAAERREIHGRIGVVQEARHGGDVAHLADELAFHYGRAGNEARALHFDRIARKRAELLQPPRAEGSRRRLDPVTETLDPDALGHAVAMCRHLLGALKVGRLYPQWSQVSAGFVAQLRDEFDRLMAAASGVTVAMTDAGPRLNGSPAPPGPVADLAALLDEQLLESVTLLRNFDRGGLETLLKAFMQPLDRQRAEPDHWDRFLTREGLEGVDLVQKAFQAREGSGARLEAKPEEPVPSGELDAVRDAVRGLKAAVDAVRLYPPGHALVEETASGLVAVLLALLKRIPSLSFGAVAEDLVLNGRPADRKFFGEGGAFLQGEIERRALKSLTLVSGLREDEVRALVSFLALSAEEQAATLHGLEGRFVHVILGSRRYERATEGDVEVTLAPPPKPIRSELRAKEFLLRSYEAFLDTNLHQQFSPLVEVLAYGTRRPLAEELVARLGLHFHDADLQHRRRAVRTLAGALALGSPSARQVEAAHSASALRRRLLEDADPGAFKLSADLLNVWIPAAATSGCLRELAEIAGPVLRRRAGAAETPKEIAEACERVLKIMPDTGAYAVLLAAAGRPKADDRLAAVSILLAIGGRAVERLVEVLMNEPDRAARSNLAIAMALGGEKLAGPLAKALPPDISQDRLERILEVAEPLLTPPLLSHFGEIAERGRPELRQAVLDRLERWPSGAAGPLLRRLMGSPAEATRDAALQAATRLRSDAVATEAARLLERAEDEHLIRVCCRYFAAVPNAGVVPLLEKIVARKPRLFGMVKGYAEETRREAKEALERTALKPAEEALDRTLHDPLTKRRER